jgi:hypothetical protein
MGVDRVSKIKINLHHIGIPPTTETIVIIVSREGCGIHQPMLSGKYSAAGYKGAGRRKTNE